jgi:hypothetical protein
MPEKSEKELLSEILRVLEEQKSLFHITNQENLLKVSKHCSRKEQSNYRSTTFAMARKALKR